MLRLRSCEVIALGVDEPRNISQCLRFMHLQCAWATINGMNVKQHLEVSESCV